MSTLGLVAVLAGSGPVQLDAPPGCSSQATVQAWVEEGLPRAPVDLDVRAVIVRVDVAWSVRVDVQCHGASHRREIDVPSCEAGAEVVAVVVGMLCEAPGEPDPYPEPDPDPDPDPERDPALVPPFAASVADPVLVRPRVAAPERPVELASGPTGDGPQRASRLRLGLRLGVGAALGGLPASGVLSGAVGLGGPRWWGWAGAEHVVVREVATSGPDRVAGRLWAAVAAVEVARRWRAGPVSLGPQIGAAVGQVQARGVGADRNLRVRRTWAELRAGAAVAVPVGTAFAFTLATDLRVPLTLHQFVVVDEAAGSLVVWRTTRVGGQLTLGVQARIL